MNKNSLAIYFIAGTQDVCAPDGDKKLALLHLLSKACKAGITCFQLREKGEYALKNADEITQLAKACQQLCEHNHVPFFINDDVALARRIKADGIHVGQSDTPIEQVIAACRGDLQIGLSLNNLEQAIKADKIDGIDYYGVGPIFSTTSKVDAQTTTGTALIQQIRQAGINKPLVGIGGINTDNAHVVRAAGADGVAVISAIVQILSKVQTIQGDELASLRG